MFSPGSSPEKMDISDDSSFEEMPSHRLARGEQLNRWHSVPPNRRVSCPPQVHGMHTGQSPFASSQTHSTVTGFNSRGGTLGSIENTLGFLQLGSQPESNTISDVYKDSIFSTPVSRTKVSETSSKRNSLSSFFSVGASPTVSEVESVRDSSDSDNMSTVSSYSTNTVATAIHTPSTRQRNITKENSSDITTENQQSSTAPREKNVPAAKQRSRCKTCVKCLKCTLFLVVLAVAVCVALVMSGLECTIVTPDIEALQIDLNDKVFGQHIAIGTVLKSLREFFDRENNDSTLVLSFHGWTGVGKNYVSSLVTSFLPLSHVVKLIIPLHFPHEGEETAYQKHIQEWILTNITKCSTNVIIIDEMDKASHGLVEGFKQVLISLKSSESNGTKSVIMVLSNSGGSQINSVTLNHSRNRFSREMLSRDKIENALMQETRTWSWYHDLYQQNLIDFLVPFLPLEKRHVKMCIESYLRSRNREISESKILEIVEEFDYFPASESIFSKSGCKRVADLAALFIE